MESGAKDIGERCGQVLEGKRQSVSQMYSLKSSSGGMPYPPESLDNPKDRTKVDESTVSSGGSDNHETTNRSESQDEQQSCDLTACNLYRCHEQHEKHSKQQEQEQAAERITKTERKSSHAKSSKKLPRKRLKKVRIPRNLLILLR